ncbi:hypothetical protein M0804_010337 [Polistes exclamans]|nr:hypothetical protein M0804_010337 [Polistes exclamans]
MAARATPFLHPASSPPLPPHHPPPPYSHPHLPSLIPRRRRRRRRRRRSSTDTPPRAETTRPAPETDIIVPDSSDNRKSAIGKSKIKCDKFFLDVRRDQVSTLSRKMNKRPHSNSNSVNDSVNIKTTIKKLTMYEKADCKTPSFR